MILAAFMTFLSSAVGALVWGTYRRLERHIDNQVARLDARIDRLEERLDSQIASVRSDLTQIAIAVGAKPQPHASGG